MHPAGSSKPGVFFLFQKEESVWPELTMFVKTNDFILGLFMIPASLIDILIWSKSGFRRSKLNNSFLNLQDQRG